MSKATNYLDEIYGSDVPHVDEGTYLAQFVGVEPAKTRFGDAFKWHWVLPAANEFELTQLTSTATTGGSNGGVNIKALTGHGLPKGKPLPTKEMVGKYATLELVVDPESGWNKVIGVHPVAAPPAAPQTFGDRLVAQQAAAQAQPIIPLPTFDESSSEADQPF